MTRSRTTTISDAKIDLLLADPVPIVSFTFGIPGPSVIRALQKAGTAVVQTVTSLHEAELAAAAGVDMLTVQASNAEDIPRQLPPSDLPSASPSTI